MINYCDLDSHELITINYWVYGSALDTEEWTKREMNRFTQESRTTKWISNIPYRFGIWIKRWPILRTVSTLESSLRRQDRKTENSLCYDFRKLLEIAQSRPDSHRKSQNGVTGLRALQCRSPKSLQKLKIRCSNRQMMLVWDYTRFPPFSNLRWFFR
jgi:transposase